MNNNKNSIGDLFSSGKVNLKDAKQAIENKDPSKIINNLSLEDKQKLNTLLNDKDAMEKALNSPEAKALMKLFSKNKK